MTVGSKLYTGCGITLVVSLLMGVFAIGNMAQLGREIEALGLVSAQNLFLSGDVNNLTSDALASINGMVLRAHLHDPDQVRQNYETAISDLKQITKENGAFIEGVSDPNLRQKAQTQIQDKVEQETELTNEVYGLITKSDLPGADELSRNQLIPLATAVSYVDNDVSQQTNQEIKQEVSHSLGRIGPARTLSLVMMLFEMMVGGVLLWVVLGINKALRSSVGDLQSGADQLAQAAAQVSSSSQALAQGATEQAASLMESSASSEQINSMARRNADNSRSTAELLSGSQQKVTEANDLLQGAVVSMDQIASSSGQISKIIKAIDEIAFQTNILALNAAVEAARAGEAGLGFAVVADEVRSLAQRSAQAAKDTATLIEDSIVKSGNGKSRVDQVALAIASVTEDTARVKVMVDEVSSGSEEQSRGIDQIGRAISKMEQVTQNAAASAEQSAAAAEELNAQSMAMKEVVGRLQVMIGGASVIPVSRPAAARSYARI